MHTSVSCSYLSSGTCHPISLNVCFYYGIQHLLAPLFILRSPFDDHKGYFQFLNIRYNTPVNILTYKYFCMLLRIST